MTDGTVLGPRSDLGLVRTSVAFTLLAAALAIALPFLNALVVALAAISLAGSARPGSLRWSTASVRLRLLEVAAGASFVGGGLLFVTLPLPWSSVRGLVLGASLLPLAAVAGRPSDRPAAGGPRRW